MPRKPPKIKRTNQEELSVGIYHTGLKQTPVGLYPVTNIKIGSITVPLKGRRKKDWSSLQKAIRQTNRMSVKTLPPGKTTADRLGPNEHFLRVTTRKRQKEKRFPLEGNWLIDFVAELPNLNGALRRKKKK